MPENNELEYDSGYESDLELANEELNQNVRFFDNEGEIDPLWIENQLQGNGEFYF